MTTFTTEFPIKAIPDKSVFIAQVLSWLRGTEYSTVLDAPDESELDNDVAHLRTSKGEELRLREYNVGNDLSAIGFRHDWPDEDGRLWRTEGVLRRNVLNDGQDLVRLRTECLARIEGAKLSTPRKPYLIKAMLLDGLGGLDGVLTVTDQPSFLPDDDSGLDMADLLVSGVLSKHLPVIYVSATGLSRWLIGEDQIRKLAYDLGGIAHIVVEPSRAFSFRLKERVSGNNVYGGTLAIAVPNRGLARQFYLSLRLPDIDTLLTAVRDAAVAFRSQMPAKGWDWTELQEQALRHQRERDKKRLSADDSEKLYKEEIDNLSDRIRQLEAQRVAMPDDTELETGNGLLQSPLVKNLGAELYPGEFSDRLRFAAKECATRADQIGLDRRSKAIFDAIVASVPPSPSLDELLEDLARATKDPKRLAGDVVRLMSRHGYFEKADNKHIRLEAHLGMIGLDAITVPKTPSDDRGMKNLRKQIERTLGLTKLTD